MTRTASRLSIVFASVLAVGLCGILLARTIRREVHLPGILAARPPAVEETTQAVIPRSADFLVPHRLDAWRIIGPGGGGAFYNIAVSPHDHNLVFVSTDMTGCYVSENGGRTWRTFNLRSRCQFVFDPKLPDRVYAIASGLFRSDDKGRTWNLVLPGADSEVRYGDDEAQIYVVNAAGKYQWNPGSIAIDPDDSNILYSVFADGSGIEKLQVSHDAGKTWKILADKVKASQIWVAPESPPKARVIYTRYLDTVGTWDGSNFVSRTVDGNPDYRWSVQGTFGILSQSGKAVMYAATSYRVKDGRFSGGVQASSDGGQTWRSLNDGILKLVAKGTFPGYTAIATSGKHAEVIYVSVHGFVPVNSQNRFGGVIKSVDGGATWSAVQLDSEATDRNIHNDWVGAHLGADWPEEPLSLAADDNDPNLVYSTDLGRVLRSADGGRNWYGVYTQSTGTGYTTTGLDVTTCYGVHFDPFDPKHMFISYTDIGLMASEDGGESWLSATRGVPFGLRSNTYWLEFDPAVRGKIWAVMSNHHDIPRARMLNHYGGGSGGVVLSVDGGHTWTVSSRGLPEAIAPTHIVLDPRSPVGARVLYMTAFGQGVYKSIDGGSSWVKKNEGLPAQAPLTWRMALAGDGTLYVVTIRRSADGKYGNENDGWLFRSRNGAENWERVPLPEGVNGPVGITVDPRDPSRLYLSTWGRYKAYDIQPAENGGVFLSSDRGAHWQNVLSASRRIYDVTVDPRNPDLVYAAGFEASAWRSSDRGKTWKRIGGFNFHFGHRVIPDPADIDKIYIATFGNSVWHGPAVGDPTAAEDIAGPAKMRFQFAEKANK